MSEVKCGVVRDLMPLVADEVASPESKELVNGHMETCEVCRAYYSGMTAQLARMSAPEDGPTSTFVKFSKRMEKKMRMKRVLIAMTAAIVALCVVVVGGMVVFDRMHTSYPMPIDKTQAWLWRENNGEVNLLVQTKDDQGWYSHLGVYREGDIYYLTPYEPELKLWNKGLTGGLYDEYQLELLLEDGRLYYDFWYGDSEFDPETGHFEHVEKEFKIPIEYVRWGTASEYTTIYEYGDEIPTRQELMEQLDEELAAAHDGPVAVFSTGSSKEPAVSEEDEVDLKPTVSVEDAA
ncbi:MAG: hypothetical protein IJO98_08125 [Clostridia bacterium]|nr:hypothetical protein [Clostridia bacterium]